MRVRRAIGRAGYRLRRGLRRVRRPWETRLHQIWYRLALEHLDRSVRPHGRAAVVMHLYHSDTWPMLAASLDRLEIPVDLIVSVPLRNLRMRSRVRKAFPGAQVVVVPNRGRDVLPFLAIASVLVRHRHEVVLKIHSKRSPHFDGGGAWLDLLLGRLLPEPGIVSELVRRLRQEDAGMAGPAEMYVPLGTYLRENRSRLGYILAETVGRDAAHRVLSDSGSHGFFAGTMFWVRLQAIRPLLRFGPGDFEAEDGQVDGTFAHAMERAFALIPSLSEFVNFEIFDGGIRERANAASAGRHHWFADERKVSE